MSPPPESRLSSKQAGQNSPFSRAEQLRPGGVFLPGAGIPAVSAQSPDLQDRAVPQRREAPFRQTAEERQLKHLEPKLLSVEQQCQSVLHRKRRKLVMHGTFLNHFGTRLVQKKDMFC